MRKSRKGYPRAYLGIRHVLGDMVDVPLDVLDGVPHTDRLGAALVEKPAEKYILLIQ